MKPTRFLFFLATLIGLFFVFSASECRAGVGEADALDDTSIALPKDCPKSVYVIAVGVNHYPSLIDFKYCVADAESFTGAIQKSWKSVGVSTDIQLLTDEDFTRDALQKAFAHVAARATSDDLFIFYYAGEDQLIPDANNEQGTFCLLAGDYAAKNQEAELLSRMKYEIPATFLKAECAKIQVKKQLIVLDTCQVGDKLDTLVEQGIQSSADQKLTEKSVVLLSSEGSAYELPDLKHGILTYSLLQGLAGQAALSSHFTGITAREMAAYLPVPLIKLSDGKQLFHGYSWGDDFTIAPFPHAASIPPTETPMRQTGPVETPPSPAEDQSLQPGKNYALIFATDHYDDAGFKSLSNPIHDAQTLADKLRVQYGFDVKVVLSPTNNDIGTELKKTRNRVYGPNDQLFVFFAGHGTKGEDDSYIVARDSKKEHATWDSYYQYAVLKNTLTKHPCPHILLALDVCYGGNFANDSVQRLPSPPRLHWADFTLMPELPAPSPDTMRLAAAHLMKDKSRVFLSSGQDVPVPDGAPGGHSPFMGKLLDALEQGWKQPKLVTAHNIYDETSETSTESECIPFDNRYLDGEFVFVPVAARAPAL